MIASSRPLRFLGVIALGWTGVRVALLWPVPVLLKNPAPSLHASGPEIGLPLAAMIAVPIGTLPFRAGLAPGAWPRTVAERPTGRGIYQRRKSDPALVALALAALVRFTQEEAVGASPQPSPLKPPGHADPAQSTRMSRWSGSAWLIARQAGPAVPFAGQLGGSQAGVRVAYLLDPKHRIAAVARVAGALAGHDTQGAIGVEWQPTRAPVRLFAEHRVAIDGGRGGPAAGVIAGLNPVRLPHGFTLDGYGQAGVIARGGTEGFADGAVHAAHPIAHLGRVRIEGGLGAWGGAQRGASRLDIGPSVAAIVPIANQRVRVTIDWRQRVAGTARPASGLALTLGADF